MIVELSRLKKDESGIVEKIESGVRAKQKLLSMGITVGKTITVLENMPFQPLIISVDNTKLAIGRGLASKIIVRKV